MFSWLTEFIDFSLKYLPAFAKATVTTVWLTVGAIILGSILGLILSLFRVSTIGLLKRLASVYIDIVRGTPLLIQILFVDSITPMLFGVPLEWYQSAILALGLNASAYIAEIIRAAIQSIDKGQMEAARSLGMGYGLAMRRIIIPQTYRRLTPPMVNEIVALTKDTSLVSIIGGEELARQGQHIRANTFEIVPTFVWVGVFYLFITVTLSRVADYYEKKLEARE